MAPLVDIFNFMIKAIVNYVCAIHRRQTIKPFDQVSVVFYLLNFNIWWLYNEKNK